ncbi:MAG: dihydroneopterin aldolase, partial [Sagittula sp.]
KNGQTCVWAPSKIVLDATEPPKGSPRDAVALSAWFAGEIEAAELLVVGESLPETAPVPLRRVETGAPLL